MQYKFPFIAALLTICIGVIVLIGWTFDNILLKSLLPFLLPMKANAAVCFILLGSGMILSEYYYTNRHAFYIGQSSAILAGLISLLTLSEYAFNINLGIDELLFDDPIDSGIIPVNTILQKLEVAYPGRIKLEASICVLLLAIASIHSVKNYWHIISVSCGVITFSLAMASLSASISPDFGQFGWFGYGVMRLNAAALFVLLSTAIIVLNWQRNNVSWAFSRFTTLVFIAGVFLMVLTGFHSSRIHYWLQDTHNEIAINENRKINYSDLLVSLFNAQSTILGYITTNDEQFLTSFQSAKTDNITILNSLKYIEHDGFSTIDMRIHELFQLYQQIIDSRKRGLPVTNDMIFHGTVLLDRLSQLLLRNKTQYQQNITQLKKNSNGVALSIYHFISSSTLLIVLVYLTFIFRFNFIEYRRKRLEEILKISEERYKTLFTHAPVGIALIDSLTGHIYYANEKYGSIVGLKVAELQHIDWMKITHPDDVQADLDNMALMNAGKTNGFTMEKRYLHANGSVIWINLIVAKLHLRENNNPCHHCIVEDITERKRTELNLRNSEQQLQLVLEGGQLGFWDWNLITNEVVRNTIWAEMLGYGYEEIQQTILQWSDLVHPDDREKAWQSIYDVLKGKKGYHELEYRMLHKDGSIRWILDHANIVQRDNNGKPTRMTGTHFDITERKLAEIEQRIAAIVFEAHEGMVVTDANELIIRVNQAFTKITGYTAEETIGKTPRLLQSGRQDTAFYARMWESINTTGAWEGEIWNRRKNGEVYPEYLTITAVEGLNHCITHYVATFNDITLSRASADEIERLAFYDPLTKLPNRRLLQDRLKCALAASHRTALNGALLFIDIDNFKNLNDTCGHETGDLLLIQIAERLLSCVRENDTVARLGGDEFIVLLEDLEYEMSEAAAQAEIVGKKILHSLNHPYQLNDHHHISTPSIGAVLFNGRAQQSSDELLKQADIAMYQAKASGRNALRFFNQQMQATIMARTALQEELHLAVIENQFILHYQPQVYQNRQITGAEVLIRWQHPKRGFILPTDFIPLAEESELIMSIGQWVLETACAQLKNWANTRHTQHLKLAVNISARQFHHPDFVNQVTRLIDWSGIDPTRLKLELTESMALDNLEETINKMNGLRKIGVQFSMDDFGTGHSSLSNLKKLPIEQLKIDQSFVRDICVDPDDAIIVQTIIAMAKNLGLEIIAEGVEMEAQYLFLEQHGCQYFQGYLFSKPVPIEQFEALIR